MPNEFRHVQAYQHLEKGQSLESLGLLDEAMAAGEVVWQGHGSLPGDDGWVSLHPADLAPLTMHHPLPLDLTPTHTALLAALDGGGAYFFAPLLERSGLTDGAAGQAALWDLVWAGLLSGDTLAPLRAHLGGGRTAHHPRAVAPRRSRYAGRAALLRSAATTATTPPIRPSPSPSGTTSSAWLKRSWKPAAGPRARPIRPPAMTGSRSPSPSRTSSAKTTTDPARP